MNSENLNSWGLLSSLLNCYPPQPFAMKMRGNTIKSRVTRPKTSQHHPFLVLPGHLENKKRCFFTQVPTPEIGETRMMEKNLQKVSTPDPSQESCTWDFSGIRGSFESHGIPLKMNGRKKKRICGTTF